ncbi:MAG: alpha-1,2-fucosyltransferase [Parvibaculum sp.]|uniref:alpha-1,2-fucosyltransferase n=1 Tax=Parvibaculum sp. TaxID=2024848 RepID=UPI003C72A760
MTSMRPGRAALFTADGRLGNQLFQAAFLDSVLKEGDRLLTLGMEDLLAGFVWDRYRLTNIRNTRARRHFKRLLRLLGRAAVNLHLVTGYRQRKQRFEAAGEAYRLAGDKVERRQGLFDPLVYIDKGYFQSAAYASHATFRLAEPHLARPRTFMAALPPGPRAFVHVRRGDYKSWRIFGRSPLLDLDYFRRGVSLIRNAAPDTQFILLSDEIASVSPQFPGIHVFHGASVYEDFGLMTLCDGGIVSNSTLSWWGGYFCGRKLPIVSPKGWLAPGLGFEYPAGITAEWMTPIEP